MYQPPTPKTITNTANIRSSNNFFLTMQMLVYNDIPKNSTRHGMLFLTNKKILFNIHLALVTIECYQRKEVTINANHKMGPVPSLTKMV